MSVLTWEDSRAVPATVRQLLETPRLQTRLLRGARGIDRPISWPHTCEMPDPWEWLDRGDFLMTIGYGVPPESEAQERYLEQLTEHGISGVTIAEDALAPPLSERMLRAADRLGLPLLRTAYEVPFAALARVVIHANQHEERQLVARTERLYDCVRRAALDGGGTESLLSGVSEELHCVLRALDLATWRNVFPPEEPVPEGIRDTLRQALIQRGGHLPGILRIEVSGTPAIAVPVPSRRPVALLAVQGPAGPPALALLQHGATIVALEVERLYAERASQRRKGVELLASILRGRIDPAAAATRLRELNFADGPFLVAICEGPGRGLHEDEIDDELRAAGIAHLLLLEEHRVVAVLSDREESLEALRRALGPSARVGIRDGVEGVGQLADGVREARWALAHSGEATFTRYGHHGGAFLPRTVSDARAAVDQVLGPLLEYDRRRGTELVRSLAVLLHRDRASQQAADDLFIHRQTLVFRMKRVEELTGRRLRSIADVAELWHALQALEMLEGHDLLTPAVPD